MKRGQGEPFIVNVHLSPNILNPQNACVSEQHSTESHHELSSSGVGRQTFVVSLFTLCLFSHCACENLGSPIVPCTLVSLLVTGLSISVWRAPKPTTTWVIRESLQIWACLRDATLAFTYPVSGSSHGNLSFLLRSEKSQTSISIRQWSTQWVNIHHTFTIVPGTQKHY